MTLKSRIKRIYGRVYRNPFVDYLKAQLRHVQVQYKILGLVVGVVLLLSSMIVWQMGNILTNNLRDQLDKRAVSIGSDVY